jgi:hypothetical protein
MTRDEAKDLFRNDKNFQGCYQAVLTKVDMIFDAFEKDCPHKVVSKNRDTVDSTRKKYTPIEKHSMTILPILSRGGVDIIT